jgi:hypothetical protein
MYMNVTMTRFWSIILVLLIQVVTNVDATTMAGAEAIKNLPKSHGKSAWEIVM